jgi:NAD(P)H-nitrite reductase large subunit
MARTEKTKYLIIGNSAGGIGAAEAIREVDKAGAITIISDEPYPAYSRPMISEYLAERCPLEKMLYRPADFYEKNGIRAILGEKVAQIDFNERAVKLQSGQIISWQKLLLATGGLPILPRMEGIGLKGIFTFNKLDDARAIDELLNQYTRKVRAVVIGGGLIGVSVTEALVKRGVQVTIVEMKERILNTMLDEEASALEEQALAQARVEIITGHTADRINSYWPGEATSVSLDDGRLIPCDIIIIAIGVQPRLELISTNSMMTNRGILVDLHMETSVPDVYACGDVAEAYDFIYRKLRLNPVWPNAYMGGSIAGLNMAGVQAEYLGGTAINAMKYFGVNILSAGMVTPPDDSHETVSERHGDIYKKVVLKDGMIVGMVFAGDIEKSGIVYNLMKDRVNVDSFKEALVANDFGLASLPEEIWRARLAIPPSELTSSATPVEKLEEVLISE